MVLRQASQFQIGRISIYLLLSSLDILQSKLRRHLSYKCSYRKRSGLQQFFYFWAKTSSNRYVHIYLNLSIYKDLSKDSFSSFICYLQFCLDSRNRYGKAYSWWLYQASLNRLWISLEVLTDTGTFYQWGFLLDWG